VDHAIGPILLKLPESIYLLLTQTPLLCLQKGSSMILTHGMSQAPSQCFPLPTWFSGQAEEIVLWDGVWWPSVDACVSFLQRIPCIHTLTLRGVDMDMVLQAVEIQKDTSILESLPSAESGSTTGEQVVTSRKNVLLLLFSGLVKSAASLATETVRMRMATHIQVAGAMR